MKRLKSFFVIALCVFLTACYEGDGYESGYDDGCSAARDELSEYGYEMYKRGYDEAYRDIVEEIIDYEAVHYARNFSNWHPEEAMGIIDCYESGDRYYGDIPITEEDYRDAIKSLYHYYAYFYSALYEDDIKCSYDFFTKNKEEE